MKYHFALLVMGIAWFGIASSLMSDIYNEGITAGLLCAVITSFVIGTIFRGKIQKSTGWSFFLLCPLVILATALLIYGILIPTAWLIFGRNSGFEVPAKMFFELPLIFLVSAFTITFPILYPLTLGTNLVLKKVLN